MTERQSLPDVERVLAGLKDFQRRTVDYVFSRMYLDDAPARRFLIADEVGLGKTLVARGIIARAIEHLWDKVGRSDIVYICSNSDIARQNINRLNVAGGQGFSLASRLTLLPVKIKDLSHNKLNFISFTPGTSLELQKNLGRGDERVLLYWLLKDAWRLRGTAAMTIFQGNVRRERSRRMRSDIRRETPISQDLARSFRKALQRHMAHEHREGKPTLKQRFGALSKRFGRARKSRRHIPREDRLERKELVGELRAVLAAGCVEALEPDLIILDEFQRFKHLLEGDDPAARLARELFDYEDARVLLLSATPYKMYTLHDEAGHENHYEDFLRTLRFLEPGEEAAASLEKLLGEYRLALYRLHDGPTAEAVALRDALERRLRAVMVRTERLAVTEDRNGMLREIAEPSAALHEDDLAAYITLQQAGRAVGAADALEYWKSAPYLLNFMEHYELKKKFEGALASPEREKALRQALADNLQALLPWDAVTGYARIDPGNARMRGLMEQTIETGAWRLLWVPPALPYYQLEGPFADPALARFTKRLVFSSWHVVPKTVSALLSYEAERCMIRSFEDDAENTPEARKRRRALLRFTRDDGRLSGMPVLGMLYPCLTLARELDPVSLAREAGQGPEPPSLSLVLDVARGHAERLLGSVRKRATHGAAPDEAWYWAAPILIDAASNRVSTLEWFDRRQLAEIWAGQEEAEDDGEETLWDAHVDRARELLAGELELGPMPEDLPEVVALLGLASPGVAARRALGRVAGAEALVDFSLADAAAQVAWSFRTLFNLPEVMALLRGSAAEGAEAGVTDAAGSAGAAEREHPYWRQVLGYCARGGLQSTLDEYAHGLRESLGLLSNAPNEVAPEIAEAMRTSIGLRTPNLGVYEIKVDGMGSRLRIEPQRMRSRFAMRFGAQRSDDARQELRADAVRGAFNSPFWPFVLATTSVGQEGLDFHSYCHAVVHWNLPSNPVDLEQREGRVHRYKGHAVRRNVAQRYGMSVLQSAAGDLWEALFELARRDRGEGVTDLVPFWIYPLEDGATIERHVPALPLSREVERLERLRRSLVVYRMVFGQPRQEDLVAYLVARPGFAGIDALANRLRVDLEPDRSG